MCLDVSARNIAFTSSCFKDCSEERLAEILGLPKTEELRPVDGEPLKAGLPKYIVQSTLWEDWLEEDDEDIRLIDWGEAFSRGAEPVKIAQPFGLNAPETVFTPRIDYRIDLWRAGWIVSTDTSVSKSQRLIKFITDSLSHIFSKAIPSIRD